MYSLIRDLICGAWAISPEGIATYSHAVLRLLTKQEGVLPRAAYNLPKQVKAKARKNAVSEYNITKIYIEGAITKDSVECQGFGTKQLAEQFIAAEESSDGILLVIDSPGGQVSGTDTFAKIIANSKVPVLAFVDDGTMASAAYWLGSQAAEIWSSNPHNTVGSIGVMATFADMTRYWESIGVKIHEIYSTLSPQKNADFAEALRGNYEPLQKNMLDKIALDFHAAVKQGRGKKINPDALKGASYSADVALEMGLIDKIGSEQEAITRLAQLIEAGKKAQSTTVTYQSNHMSTKSRWGNILSLVGFAQVDAEAGKITVNGQEADLLNEKLEAMSKELKKLTAERDRLQKKLNALTAEKNALIAEKAKLKAKIAKLPAAAATVVTAESDSNSKPSGFPVDPQIAHFARLAQSKIGRK
jgi:ClpP class serine protease